MAQSLIIDPSVLIQAFITDTYTVQAQALVRETHYGVWELHAPEFYVAECTNILWKQVAFRGVPLAAAQQSRAALLQLPMTAYVAAPLSERGLEIAATYHLAVYNSLYLALGEVLGIPLVTEDHNQAKVALALGLTLKPVMDF